MAKQYSEEDRVQALKLAGEIGSKAAAERLGINLDTLYTWISKAKHRNESEVPRPAADELRIENERLRKTLAEKEQEIEILQDALGFFVKRRKR